jgi:alkylation response protein AidB-like acyl-CoA dehydrogenase
VTSTQAGELAQVTDEVLARHWGRPALAATADLDALWSAAATGGWFELAGSLDRALAIVAATGRQACPLPVMDAFIATEVLADCADLAAPISVGAIRLVLSAPPDSGGLIEAGGVATHVLELPQRSGEALLRPVRSADPVPGLAVPPWYRVELGDPQAGARVSAEAADRICVLRRLGLAARALAAAGRAHELALAHAKVRQQFGQPVGSFGAVRQRLVDCHLELTAATALITESAGRYGTADWRTTAELAVASARRVAPLVQFAAHRTLAAAGYFEQHDAPWLFRRVHADLAWLPALRPPGGDVAGAMIDGRGDRRDAGLPDPLLPPAAEAARARFRRFLADRGPMPEATAADADHRDTVAAMGAAGWLAMGWPEHAGGRDAGMEEQAAVALEVFQRRVPVLAALATATTVGAAIARHGTRAQRADLLPRIARGELVIAVGYSEPEAGSDLAALRTQATRDGDDWLITGQKAWTAGGHRASLIWLAARTGPDSITMFLVPADSPGITMRPDVALSGQVACGISFDAVRVPDTARVGPAGEGFRLLGEALTRERGLLGGIAATAHRQLADLAGALDPASAGELIRDRLTELAARVQATRLLAVRASNRARDRQAASVLASAAKVLGSELAEDIAATAMTALGPAAARPGATERSLLLAPGNVIAGGTNDVHRGLIARALGLPTT